MPPHDRLTPLLAVITLPAGILTAIELGVSAALVVFVVGWLLLVPVSALVVGPNPAKEVESAIEGTIEEESAGEESDPLETARRRYTRGEIDETELERRLAALLETEAVDPADEEAVERTIERVETEPERSRAGGKNRR